MIPEKSKLKARFIVCDTETSGIDEKTGIMLELAAAALDENLDLVGEFHSLVKDPAITESFGELTREKYFTDFTWKMHTDNGLLEELRYLGAGSDPESVSADFVKWAAGVKSEAGHDAYEHGYEIPLMLVGNNPESFDKRWLEHHMPDAAKVFHYRPLNVSSLRWGMSIALDVDAREIKKELGFGGHRAKDDVKACIEELKFYVKMFRISTEMFSERLHDRLRREAEEDQS